MESSPKSFDKPILITQPLLPDLNAVAPYLKKIWDSNQLTNNGMMSRHLENELKQYLKVSNLSLFSNGTIALQVACKVLRLSGEVITTPFTFAATPHSLAWCGVTPVFCDIENETLNIDVNKIESLITEKTTGILPVHVFGNPCKVDEIQRIAEKYNLKVLYDAAHAFGVEVDGRPIGGFGDISMFSLHATKIYHTVEGGALTFANPELKQRADWLRNFGLISEECVMEPGTNGKLNELQAAIGILVLELVDEEINNRREIVKCYRDGLSEIEGLKFLKDMEGIKHNYPYFPIRIDSEKFGISRDELHEKLKGYNVFSRRYFYPLCSSFQCYRNIPSSSEENLKIAAKVAQEVLALPLHGRMKKEDVEATCAIIRYLAHK